MRKTKIVQVLRYFSLATMLLSGSVTVAAAGWQDGVVIKGEKGSEATDVRIGQERYGPISSNDTLWDIAQRYKPHSSVTQYQTMVAIVQANDEAFVDGNMNRMLDGFYLRIPSLQEIKMVNPEAARRQVVVDGQLKSKSQQLSQARQDTQETRAEQQELLEQAREKAEQTIQEVEQRQEQNFQELRSDMQQSMQAVERMYEENKSLQERIDALASRLDELTNNVSKTDELEVQFQQVLAQQRELLNSKPGKK
jgi:FimV N-terminal domain